MFITIEPYLFQCRQWMDKTLMENYLTDRSGRYHILGGNIEQPREFFSIIIELAEQRIERVGIGICSIGVGLLPHILPLVQAKRIIVGFNSDLYAINLSDATLDFHLELDSLFYCFVPVHLPNRILVQHEIGLVMLTEDTKILWKFARDVITSQQVTNGKIFLEFMDSPSVFLSLESGHVLQELSGCNSDPDMPQS